MNDFKDSMILMGIDWSKAAKKKAFKDIKRESPRVAGVLKYWIDSIARRIRLSW